MEETSVLLSARFGGTPWAWRWGTEPDERDWGTATTLLAYEAEQVEEAEHKAKRR